MSNDKSGIKSIYKALDVLEVLAAEKKAIGVTELSNMLGVRKSTLHGTLSTLLERGYLEQEPDTGKYKLGIAILSLANSALGSLDLRNQARPVIAELCETHNETVHLAVLRQGEVVYIDKRESEQSMRIHTEIGKRLPAHCTGVGKVLLAWLDKRERDKIVALHGLARYTVNTITDQETLEKHLAEIRKNGYAIDNEEIEEGLRCVAAPIVDFTGKVIAAVSIAGPSIRINFNKIEEMVGSVTEAARKISRALGYNETQIKHLL